MLSKLLLPLFLLTFSLSALADDLPDSRTTPGATDSAINQANIHETICVKGYTKTVRPPAHYTSKMKRRQIGREGDMRDYEEDHLISLNIGGTPTDERNLWPEPRGTEYGADKKNRLELRLMNLVCRGNLPLATAQHDIATNWIEAYKKYGGEIYHGHSD